MPRTTSIGLFLTLLMPVSLSLSCSSIASMDTIQVVQHSRATVPAGTVLGSVLNQIGFSGLVSMDLENSEEFRNRGVKKNQIRSVRLRRLTLEVVEPPENQDLTFLDSLSFHLEAQGLPRRRVAHGGSFPTGLRKASLKRDGVEWTPYATAPSMTVISQTKGRLPEQETVVEVEVTLDVEVDLAGAVLGWIPRVIQRDNRRYADVSSPRETWPMEARLVALNIQ